MNVDMINLVNSLNLKDSKVNFKTPDSKDKFTKVMEREGQKSSSDQTENKLEETNKTEEDTKETLPIKETKKEAKADDKNLLYYINPNLIVKTNLNLDLEAEGSIEELGLVPGTELVESSTLENENILNLVDIEGESLKPKENLAIKDLLQEVVVKEDLVKDDLIETVEKISPQIEEVKVSLGESELKSRLNLNSANRVINKQSVKEVETEIEPIAVSVESEVSNEQVKMNNLNTSQDEEAPADENLDNLNLEFKEVIQAKTVVKEEKLGHIPNLDRFKIENLDDINTEMIRLVETTNNGETSHMKVQLYPKDLGSLDINLTMENGHLKAKILVENESVRNLFTKSLDELNQNLLKQNIEVKEFLVDVNTGFNEKNQEEQNQNKKRNTFVKEFTLSNEEEAISIRSAMDNTQDLNILA